MSTAMLAEFEGVFGQTPPPPYPTLPDPEIRSLRITLLAEEFKEYLDAEKFDNLVEVADALGDMVYIIFGTARAYGIDLDAVLDEIHDSNMAKAPDGVPIYREDGKVLKPKGWTPPDIEGVLRKTARANVAYTVCGCSMCMALGYKQAAIYDGTIVTAYRDGTFVNRFAGEGSRREDRAEAIAERYRSGEFTKASEGR